MGAAHVAGSHETHGGAHIEERVGVGVEGHGGSGRQSQDIKGIGFSPVELLEGESSACSLLEVVLEGAATNHGAKAVDRAGSHASSLE